MSEEKVNALTDEGIYKKFMKLPVFLVLLAGIVAMALGKMPAGMIGGNSIKMKELCFNV